MLYRCVNCGGNVVYDPAKKKMVCLSCGGSDCQELVPSQEPVICINCGSQIPYTEYQSAGRCPSCGTYLLRDDKVNYPYGADVILPFKISKHEAEEKLRNEFGKKLFIPGTFLSQTTGASSDRSTRNFPLACSPGASRISNPRSFLLQTPPETVIRRILFSSVPPVP